MEKFLSIPVTGKTNQLISANDILIVRQASTTTVVINYAGGKVTTLTHAAAPASNEEERDIIQNAIVQVLQQSWTNVALEVINVPFAVSAIAIA